MVVKLERHIFLLPERKPFEKIFINDEIVASKSWAIFYGTPGMSGFGNFFLKIVFSHFFIKNLRLYRFSFGIIFFFGKKCYPAFSGF